MRRRRLECLLLWSVAVTTASNSDLFTAPTSFDAASVSTWREKLLAWRAAIVAEIGYNGSIYDEPALAWSRLAYVQPQVHLYDRALYSNGSYTVETFLDGLEHRMAASTPSCYGLRTRTSESTTATSLTTFGHSRRV